MIKIITRFVGIFAIMAIMLTAAACDMFSDDENSTVAVSGITLDRNYLTLVKGKTFTLEYSIMPDDATNKDITWESSDPGRAAVDNTGTVTAVAAGTAIVSVTAKDGRAMAQCFVTVLEGTGAHYIEMVWIPAGTFTMGSPVNEPDHKADETQHQVTLSSGFYMGKYQVTQKEWVDVMGGSNPSYFHGGAGREPAEGEVQNLRPVESVSWYDAIEFCNKLSEKDDLTPYYTINKTVGSDSNNKSVPLPANPDYDQLKYLVTVHPSANGYRLPTEAQWEYACRAGTTSAYNTGLDDITNDTGWYMTNSGNKTHQVGLKPPNVWGLYDMHGNVMEWCWDWYGPTYPTSPQTDPVGPDSGANRVERGGVADIFFTPDFARSAARFDTYASSKFEDLGFRVVRP